MEEEIEEIIVLCIIILAIGLFFFGIGYMLIHIEGEDERVYSKCIDTCERVFQEQKLIECIETCNNMKGGLKNDTKQ